MNTILKIRTSFCYLCYILLTAVMVVLFLPVLISKRLARSATQLWLNLLLCVPKLVCNLDYKVIGAENIPKGPFIIASKHQSAFETFILPVVFPSFVFILKRELVQIPLVGFYLKRIGMIHIDRSRGGQSIRFMQKQLEELPQDSVLIIFPEGTRTKPGQTTEKYRAGVSVIYETLKWPVVPVAVDTGMFWPKVGNIKSGTATIKILPPITQKNYDRKKFLGILNEVIESNSLELYKKNSNK